MQLFTSIITQYQPAAFEDGFMAGFKGEATIVLSLYASRLEENSGKLPNMFFYPAGFSQAFFPISRWMIEIDTQHLKPFYESLERASLDAFRHRYWFLVHASDVSAMMLLWTKTVSTIPHTDDVRESVIDTVLRMMSWDDLLPHIPTSAWEWLKKRPYLPPDSPVLQRGISPGAFERIQQLGDVELTASYLFIIWAGESCLHPKACTVMVDFIRTRLCGVPGARHRVVLIQRLDDVLSRLEPTTPESVRKVAQYEEFREALDHCPAARIQLPRNSRV